MKAMSEILTDKNQQKNIINCMNVLISVSGLPIEVLWIFITHTFFCNNSY